jgi:hypothetical protein
MGRQSKAIRQLFRDNESSETELNIKEEKLIREEINKLTQLIILHKLNQINLIEFQIPDLPPTVYKHYKELRERIDAPNV